MAGLDEYVVLALQREEAVTKAKIQSFRSGATAQQQIRGMTPNEYLAAMKHLTGL